MKKAKSKQDDSPGAHWSSYKTLVIPLERQLANDLYDLLNTGRFGRPTLGISSVAEELLREKVRELVLQGWLKP